MNQNRSSSIRIYLFQVFFFKFYVAILTKYEGTFNVFNNPLFENMKKIFDRLKKS